MKDFIEDDLDSFLDTEEFADTVTVGGIAVAAIFSERYVEVNLGSTPYSGFKPTLFGKESDFTYGAAVVAEGDSFTIVDIQPDGTGFAVAVLTEA